MLEIFKSRKSSMVIIGIITEVLVGIFTKTDVTNQIVALVALYVTGNVVQKATRKDIENE